VLLLLTLTSKHISFSSIPSLMRTDVLDWGSIKTLSLERFIRDTGEARQLSCSLPAIMQLARFLPEEHQTHTKKFEKLPKSN
jgi:hypothetical protein